MSISLCMIAKNEEENLARCLNSVKGLVDEIILVDTGSEDRTVPIALQYGAKVFGQPWNDSFSEARNYALSKASGDWFLIMDADDELKSEDREALLGLVREAGTTDVYCCRTLSYSGCRADCGSVLVTMSIRLIRSGKGLFYRGRVHEQLTGPGGPPRITATGIRFYHYGYLLSQIEKKGKHVRNIALIRRELKEDPENGFMLFNLGNEYLSLGDAQKAMDCYTASRRVLEPSQGYGSMLLTRMALCSAQLRRTADQRHYVDEGLALYPALPDFEYLKGCLLHRNGQLLQAARSYRKCIRMGPPPPDENSALGVSTFKPHERLAAMYEQLGDRKQALRHCRAAIRFNPSDREAYERIFRLLREEGVTPERLKTRLQRLAKDEICPLLILSDLFYDRGMYRQALSLALRAAREAPGCQSARCDEGICRFFLGQYRRAYRCLRKETCVSSGDAAFFRKLCMLLDPSLACRSGKDLEPELTRADRYACRAFECLMKSEACPDPPGNGEKIREYADAVFGLLEVLLRAGLIGEFLKALRLVDLVGTGDNLLRLGKLYYRYGYLKLAYEELRRSFCDTGRIDAEGLLIMSRVKASEQRGQNDAQVM